MKIIKTILILCFSILASSANAGTWEVNKVKSNSADFRHFELAMQNINPSVAEVLHDVAVAYQTKNGAPLTIEMAKVIMKDKDFNEAEKIINNSNKVRAENKSVWPQGVEFEKYYELVTVVIINKPEFKRH